MDQISGTTPRQSAGKTAWYNIVGWVRQESAATSALVQAFIALGVAFAWWHWTPAQTGAVFGIVAALLGMFVRSQVTPIHPFKPGSGQKGGLQAGPAADLTPGASHGPYAEAAPEPTARPDAEEDDGPEVRLIPRPGPAPVTRPDAGPNAGPEAEEEDDGPDVRLIPRPGPAPVTRPDARPNAGPDSEEDDGPDVRLIPRPDARPDDGEPGSRP